MRQCQPLIFLNFKVRFEGDDENPKVLLHWGSCDELPAELRFDLCTCNMGNMDDSEKMDGSKARHSRVLVQAINLTLSVFNERIP